MNYATIKNFDIANGEGVRVSLFVSGCKHHCPGCFNSIAWDFNYGEPFTKEVALKLIDMLKDENIRGLSLLGGEPFDPTNQIGLIDFIRLYKKELPSKDLWCYTGYTYDVDLAKGGIAYTDVTDELLSYIDILVDGKFILEKKNISLQFRGSENQRIINMQETLKQKKVVLREDLMIKK